LDLSYVFLQFAKMALLFSYLIEKPIRGSRFHANWFGTNRAVMIVGRKTMLLSADTYLFAAVIAFGLLFFIWRAASVYLKFRGVRLVSCPETAEAAAVEVDASHAALSGGIGDLDLRLKSCSRWPERQGCGQECLAKIEAAPEDCLVRTILTKWYKGKSCIYCGKPLEEMDWLEHKPALMSPDHVTVEWKELRPETIPEVLATYTPVCWNCHVAQSFRRRYPHLVVDRPWQVGAGRRSR